MSGKILEPNLWNLGELFTHIYEVPVYQRPYSWDKEQIDTLLDDIISAYNSPSKNEGYYTGNIMIYDKNDKINGLITKYDIIDGQQRITSFALILLGIYTLSLEAGVSESDKTLGAVKEALWKYVNRTYNKDLKAISLNSIEKKCFSDLYDYCYDSPKKVESFCKNYHASSQFDKRVISNFTTSYNRIRNEIFDGDPGSLLDFADYILQYIQFIVIEAYCNNRKVFSIFESLNSKGKKLEEIDLIKTYIFSVLDEESYATYLDKWGYLIIATDDKLYDYLSCYIKAYLCFYRQSIKIANFKTTITNSMLQYYRVNSKAEAFKKLLDDMYEKVDFYNMLSSPDKAYKLVKNNKFRFYFEVFNILSYQHPKALFMRTLIEYYENNIAKDDVVEIISQTTSFMVKFLTICNRDSKDIITMFSDIMKDIHSSNSISKDPILKAIAAESVKRNLTTDSIKSDLEAMDAYKNRDLTITLLSLYDSTQRDTHGTYKTSYDQAFTLVSSSSSAFSLDHLLVQRPKKDSSEFKYYRNDISNTLKLKPGHDFPADIRSGMDYDTFTEKILNKIGNLRILYKDKNSSRKNNAIVGQDFHDFNGYNDIEKRSNEVISTVIDYCLPELHIELAQIKTSSHKKNTQLPKMKELIDSGLIHKGDQVYLTPNPNNSTATIIDSKYVRYNGKKMTLNDWGCTVTGWASINIYQYAALVGETETLHTKRLLCSQS